ncbi:MAG TPA: peptidoglycan recognition family protein [Ktedonosporobacter sp.]|nr:peptidoglycan recognition family protein [Ktedonosporobacter sp.]
MPDETGAIWIPSPNYFPEREGHHPRWIIVHGTAGFTSAEEVGYFFQQANVATHYIIGRNGIVVQAVEEKHGAYGNGHVTGDVGVAGDGKHHDPWWSVKLNPNLVTISIEHVKPSLDNTDELTEAQKLASFRLIQHICERHNIPKQLASAQGGITGHYSMDPIHRWFCPGPYPWNELIDFLKR